MPTSQDLPGGHQKALEYWVPSMPKWADHVPTVFLWQVMLFLAVSWDGGVGAKWIHPRI